MNNSNSDGFFAVLILIGHACSWIFSGTVAWNWIDPESFGGAVLFMIAWGFLGKIFDIIAVAVIAGLASVK